MTIAIVRFSVEQILRLTVIISLVFASSAYSQILINEVDADQTGTDSAEFLELYDGGAGSTSLDGLVLVFYNGSNDLSYRSVDLDGLSTGASGYFVLCGNAATTPNCDLDVSPDTNLIQNGADALALYTGDASAFPNSSAITTANLIDAIAYDTSDGDDAGILALLNAGQPQVNENGNGAKDTESNQRCANGSGGARNTSTYVQALPTPGAANDCGDPVDAELLINEFDADQSGTDSAEFVELFDGGVGNTDLSGHVLVLFNGSDDASYNAFDLDGQSTNGAGYFVLCGDAANTANCDLDVSPDSNLIQNGADAIALYVGDGAGFPGDTAVTTSNLLDAAVYDTDDGDDSGLLVLLNPGQPQINERAGGDGTGHSNQRCDNGTGGARNTNTYIQTTPTPGAENSCSVPLEVVKIHEVQGSGSVSPLANSVVAIEGIVIGDFQNGASGSHRDLDGFMVQEEDTDADADPLSSEGIFVFEGSSPVADVAVGDLVRVEGRAVEFNGLTELNNVTKVTVVSSGNPLPAATNLSLPLANADALEPVEGMLVTFAQSLVISGYANFDRFGEVVLTSKRTLTPTAEFEPGPDAIAAAEAFQLDQLVMDDGRTASNPDPAIHPNGLEFNLDNLFRGGDTVTDATGIMHFAFGAYRLHPTQGANYANDNPRTAEPAAVGGNFKAASFNVLNYFSTIDQTPNRGTCGPMMDQGCRGADDENEFTRQRDKIFSAINAIDADVVGLVEIENHPDDAALADLVAGLNAVAGPDVYDYIPTGPIGGDVIKVALIYKPAAVSPYGDFAVLDSSVDARFDDQQNRPVLAQSFIDDADGGIVTVAINHFKSKGGDCDDLGDPDLGDGAGNCNLTRTSAAAALADWLAGDPTDSGDVEYLILGDLNSYDKEDPIDTLVNAGNTDLIRLLRGEDAYGYVFANQIGYLDYALSSPDLTAKVTGVAEWHINADEPDLIDYETRFKQAAQIAIYAPDAYRSSDHDPVVVGLDVCDEIPPSIDSISLTPDVLWPANHKYVDVTATVIASDNFDPSPLVSLLSVSSNEPDNGVGDGNTVNDIVVIDDNNFRLRAERSGKGSGRVYSISYLVTDACGNTGTGTATVSVPHSKGKK